MNEREQHEALQERKARTLAVCELYVERGWSADLPNAMADAIEDLQTVARDLYAVWTLHQAFEGS